MGVFFRSNMDPEQAKDLFRYFVRQIYPDVAVSNKTLDEVYVDFSDYIDYQNWTELEKETILPRNMIDVIVNIEHPFRVKGFHPALILYFQSFVDDYNRQKEEEEEQSKSQ